MDNHHRPIPEAVQQALAEVLNLAAEVAEMQLDDQSREGIYELLDSVANYFDIDSHRIDYEELEDDDAPAQITTRIVDSSTTPPLHKSYTLNILGEDTPLPDRDFPKITRPKPKPQ